MINLEPVNRTYKITVLQSARNAQTAAALNNQMGQVARSTKQVTNNARGAALATRNLGYVAQNASYQIADFFVMLQGGVGVGRALSTQLPQLLAGFGAFGAVLGAVAAIGASAVVMLKEQSKVTADLSEVTERYTDAWTKANDALNNVVFSGEAGTRTLYQFRQEALKAAEIDLNAALSPPDPNAWDGFITSLKGYFVDLGTILSFDPRVQLLIDAFKFIKGGVTDVAEVLTEADQVAKQVETSVIKYSQELNNAQVGTDRFQRALRLYRTEMNNYFYYLGNLVEPSISPILDDARQRVQELRQAFTQLTGTNDIRLWPEVIKKQFELATEQLKYHEDQVADLVVMYGKLTEKLPSGLNRALFRQTELEKQIQVWKDAADAGFVLKEAAESAVRELTRIDLWTDLQDAIIATGSALEDRIIQAMKNGKFAVEDFVTYAIEQFARIALSRVLEPFFNLLANSIPTLGGTGSPSPSYTNPLGNGRMMEPPPSAAPMYNFGESISRVPGGSRNKGVSPAGNVTVNVNNYGNDKVEIKERKTAGGVEVDVLIKAAVQKGIARGDFDQVMQSSFGTRRLAY